MRRIPTSWHVRGVLILLTALLYATNLDRSPIYLNNDEAAFALQAHAIATTGRDVNGRLLPLYFQIHANVWYHPLIVYAMAAAFWVLPFAEWAARVPSVCVAILNVVLVHAIVRRLSGREVTAAVAAAVLMLTPAHFMHARLACDYIFPVPFALGWLYCLLRFLESSRRRWAIAAVAALGLGMYSYIAAIVLMPLLFLVTLLVLWARRYRDLRLTLLLGGVFATAVLPLVAWLIAHPEMYAGLAGRYRQYSVDVVGAPGGLVDPQMLRQRLEVYGLFFDPWFLFDVAESNVISSTYRSGVFLKGMAVFGFIGLIAIARARLREWRLVLLLLVLAPLPACLIVEPYAIDRALVMVGAGVLVSAAGIDWLWRIGRPGQLATAAVLVWMVWQFDAFHRDYLRDYPVRSAFWFNGNNRGAMQDVIRAAAGDPRREIYLADNIPFVQIYWNLYLRLSGREDLLTRTQYFNDATPIEEIPDGSILLTNAGDPIERQLLLRPDVHAVRYITEPDGARTFVRFEKTRSGLR
jgi:4-amino-4-deoxy-L-arabinose transferase-like glycosyltransferase